MRRPGYTCAVALLLPVAVVAAYWPALRGGLLWDDDAHVTRPDLRSIGGLGRIWSEPGTTQQYYPVLHSAFWVEHRLWGEATLGYHLVNLALHLAACLLLYHVLRRLSVPGALLAVTLFALHPVCAETVAWISEQKNTLSTVFYLGAALAYLRFDAERKPRWYALGLGCFALALLSKSVTATLPAALLVVLWWKRGRLSWKGDAAPLVPWFVLAIAAGSFTSWVERTFIGARGVDFALNVPDRLLVAGRALWFYLGKDLWPADLAFIYPRWDLAPGEIRQWLYPVAALLAFGVLWALRRRSRGPLAAALLFAGALFPVLGFVNVYPFVFSFVADHFQYLAAAALIPALVAGAALGQARLHANPWVLGAAAGCVLCLLAFQTARQARLYRDSEVFYRGSLQANPASWLAHDNLGVVLAGKGQWEEASAHYREAMRLKPDYPESYNDYGNVLARAGRWDEAAAQYAQALRVRPSFAAAEKNWGVAMNDAGRYREAETHFRQALRLRPDYADAHYGLANALANSGRLPEAIAEFRATLRLEPQSPEAHANLGLAYAEQDLWADALQETGDAIRLRPGYAEAHAYRGFALSGAGRPADAVTEFSEALRVGRDNPDVHYQLGMALRKLGRVDEAKAQFDAAQHAATGR
jgi:tetratricopeptide (TPR) repeat protein